MQNFSESVHEIVQVLYEIATAYGNVTKGLPTP